MSHTGNMPWDKDDDKLNEEYEEIFPKSQRRFTFTEMKKRLSYSKQRNERWRKI